MKIFKIAGYVLLAFVGLFIVFITYSTITDYKPDEVVSISKDKGDVVNIYDTIRVMSWNIGYCGLDKDMSFFYDGGDKVRTTKEQTLKNLNNVRYTLKINDSIDFYLLQEVDKRSRRSYNINEFDSILPILKGFNGYFTPNYKVPFVPAPVTNPLGKVYSGLASFSKYKPFHVDRYAFPGNYPWPKGLFLLDRCFMVQRFYTSNGKELVIVNTHNSAFDDGSLRKKQMEMLREFLQIEYKKGNYVVVGGDWNQEPPHKGEGAETRKEKHLTRVRIADNFMPDGWYWIYNENTPTNRLVNEVYSEGKTITITIDFFLASPNIIPIELKNENLNFENTDHNPVIFTFKFDEE